MDLPVLSLSELRPTRDYLQDAAKVLGKLQQAFLPPSPRDWQYGLEVTMRGICTQSFDLNGQPTRALLDLVRQKLRAGDQNWRLRENPPALLLQEVQAWLDRQGQDVEIQAPQFSTGLVEFDTEQVDAYAAVVWWMEERFRKLKENLAGGVTAPILLYPHHFDLSLAWFPWDDERQIAVGWSTGDETVTEPYVYLTAYPEPEKFKTLALPAEARWQSDGFSGAVLPYAALQKSANPEDVFSQLAELFPQVKRLF